MSNIMLEGVLRMPYEMAMGCDVTRVQFYDRAQQALDELDKYRATAEALAAMVEQLREAMKRVVGTHYAPDDCYATGPLTGNAYLDLVECPSCTALKMLEITDDLAASILRQRNARVWMEAAEVIEEFQGSAETGAAILRAKADDLLRDATKMIQPSSPSAEKDKL